MIHLPRRMSMRILTVASYLQVFCIFLELLRFFYLLLQIKNILSFPRKMQCARVAFLYNVLSSPLRSRAMGMEHQEQDKGTKCYLFVQFERKREIKQKPLVSSRCAAFVDVQRK